MAAFIVHTPTGICRGHPFAEDVLDQYGFAVAEQHFTRAHMPIVAATAPSGSSPAPEPPRPPSWSIGRATGLALAGIVLSAGDICLLCTICRFRPPTERNPVPTPEPDHKVVNLNNVRQRRTDDLLSGRIPLMSLLHRRSDRISADLLVSDVLTT